MTRPTPDHSAPGLAAADARLQPQPWAAWRRLACVLLLGSALACGGSGDSGGSGTPDDGGGGAPPLATEPVDLPPGATVAELHWAPSDGFVTNYLVFVSRNQGAFDFNQMVPTPDVEVPGVAGDEIRITVVAVGQQGDLSAASDPSVPIRFHPAVSAAVAAEDAGARQAVFAVAGGSDAGGEGASGATSDADATGSDASAVASGGSAEGTDAADAAAGSNGEPAAGFSLTRAVRERLLLGDARLALASHVPMHDPMRIDAGADWLEAQVASEVLAGLALVGTAERADGALRDLVWRDAAGRLFLSEGAAVLATEPIAETLVPAIQLGASERFVALADVDGDGLREWILEETTTGEAWIRVDDSGQARSARAAHQAPTLRLIGVGEFDGGAGSELLWQAEDGTLSLARPTSPAPTILAGAGIPQGRALVAIADFDGDGRDDLLARGADGVITVGRTLIDGQTGAFWIEWGAEHAEAGASVPLVGTLDLDQDGRAELAWLVDDAVEIRAIGEQAPRAFEF